jgi:hypothetical protein
LCNTFSDQGNYLYRYTRAIIKWFIKLYSDEKFTICYCRITASNLGYLVLGIARDRSCSFPLGRSGFHYPGSTGIQQEIGHWIMGNLMYVLAFILVIAWIVGFFSTNSGGIIHILLVIAIIAVLLRVNQGQKVT